MMNRTIVYLLLLLPFFTMCRRQSDATEQQPLSVEVLTMDTVTSVCTHMYVGRTEDADVISLSFGVAGTIEKVYVRNGDYVEAGQTLIALDATKSRSVLASAQAKLQQAKDGYARVQKVYNDGGVSELKMKEIQTQLTEAEEIVRGLQSQLDGCVLRAPIAGVVGDLKVYAGQNILPDMQLLQLHNRQGINVVYAVPEQDIVRIHIGNEITVRIPALGQCEWKGYVVERSLTPNALAHNYDVKCVLKGETSQILPGMSCTIQSRNDCVCGLMVPPHCVQTYGDGLCVWVCREGVAQRVQVQTASFGREGVLVTQGLQPADRVIVNGYQKVYNGMKVQCHETNQ